MFPTWNSRKYHRMRWINTPRSMESAESFLSTSNTGTSSSTQSSKPLSLLLEVSTANKSPPSSCIASESWWTVKSKSKKQSWISPSSWKPLSDQIVSRKSSLTFRSCVMGFILNFTWETTHWSFRITPIDWKLFIFPSLFLRNTYTK